MCFGNEMLLFQRCSNISAPPNVNAKVNSFGKASIKSSGDEVPADRLNPNSGRRRFWRCSAFHKLILSFVFVVGTIPNRSR